MIATPPHRFCTAPMMDWTDRFCRYFFRLLTRHSLLYTEMITAGAILRGDVRHHLQFDESEHPLALQLGGSDRDELAACARIAEQWGYDEINLNCGCPSDRVNAGRFGACLMKEPAVVADCVAAMKDATSLPVTVKHRLGVDSCDSYAALTDFVGTIAAAGCRRFIVHARKAWLQGLNPKQNREIPPLLYDSVYRLARDFRDLDFVVNGGIDNLSVAAGQLRQVAGVMVGREAYHNPFMLADVDRLIFGDPRDPPKRADVLLQFADFCGKQMGSSGLRLSLFSRHVLGLFQGEPGARHFRRHLSVNASRAGATDAVFREALAIVSRVHRQAV